jgi:hypothetical protein
MINTGRSEHLGIAFFHRSIAMMYTLAVIGAYVQRQHPQVSQCRTLKVANLNGIAREMVLA